MACILKRKSVIAVSFIAAFLFLLVVRLVNEVNFPLLLNCFGQPGTKWIPFSYTYRRPLRTHYGYINVKTQEPLQLDCDLCAIVSNSGQMVGQKVGNEIDRSSCIWRMNNAPTKGYEEDVGHMTMIRVVSHTSVPLLLKNPDYFFKEANTTIYVIWGPFRNMRKDGNGIVYNMLKKTVDIYPNAQIYVTTEKRMSYCDGVFKKETGKDRVTMQCWLIEQQPPHTCPAPPQKKGRKKERKKQTNKTKPDKANTHVSGSKINLVALCKVLSLCRLAA
ncbi:alpha-N-acetylgalactosaminide alpha-2,6-sialyltransferase 3 isoform X2 [Trachypithecus francoisi]|uniref:alpha-N-acetylgalactosaminide alpha-2,6-sialyltransferase 3 isoform X2 n=1 Tax=Trachypithecus francoisi TaxID=54180 RepID=UPI00141BD3A5|nr:alpha-N-acetylgalactosaminide alpha-2,6-sialyltransferase 3 isoform X2 [Trachypithecus francoisi]